MNHHRDLHQAVALGDWASVEHLLKAGADPNAKNAHGESHHLPETKISCFNRRNKNRKTLMLKKVALVLGFLIVALLVYAGMKNPSYVVSREITINAPVQKVFPYLSNMKLGDLWGPWKEMDSTATMNLEGPESGVGAKSVWKGGKQLGTGSATITEVVPNQLVVIQIEYTEPMSMVQRSEYIAEANGDQTKVTWKVSGQNSFIGRLMCLFTDMDKMVGGMFEKGLSKLRILVESSAA